MARTSDSRQKRLRVRILCYRVKPGAGFFTLYCSNSLSCTNEYLVIDSGGYLCTESLRALIAAWLDASQRSRGGVRLKGSVREVKCKAL